MKNIKKNIVTLLSLLLVMFSVATAEKKEVNNAIKNKLLKEVNCVAIYEPVCAKINISERCLKDSCPKYIEKTFINSCEANKSNAEVIEEGVCSEKKQGSEPGSEGEVPGELFFASPVEMINSTTPSNIVKDKKENISSAKKQNIKNEVLNALKGIFSEEERIKIYSQITKKNKIDNILKFENKDQKIIVNKSKEIFTKIDKILFDVNKVILGLKNSVNTNNEDIKKNKEIKKLVLGILNKVQIDIENAQTKKNEAWFYFFELLDNENLNLKMDIEIVEKKLSETKIYIKNAFVNLKDAAKKIEDNLMVNK